MIVDWVLLYVTILRRLRYLCMVLHVMIDEPVCGQDFYEYLLVCCLQQIITESKSSSSYLIHYSIQNSGLN